MRWHQSVSSDECLECSEAAYEKYCQEQNFFPMFDRYELVSKKDAVLIAIGVVPT